MKLRTLFFVFSLFFARAVFGQTPITGTLPISNGGPGPSSLDCDQTVYDLTGDLHGQEAKVEQAAQAIINEGAEVRIRILAASTNLDFVEKGYENSCESWRSGNGGRKNTLITILVAVQTHRLGIYYGGAWDHALAAHFNRIKTDYMNPRFRDKDILGGILAGEQQLAARIAASKDEALHPNAVVNQATDLSGLWTVMKWILCIIVFCLGIYGVYLIVAYLKRSNERQQRAILFRSKAATLLKKLRDVVDTAKATNQPVPGWKTEEKVNSASELFSELSNSERTNPDTQNLSAGEYDNIAEQYKSLSDNLERTLADLGPEPLQIKQAGEQMQMRTGSKQHPHRNSRKSVKEESAPSVNNTTIFVNEEVERPSYGPPDPEPTYESSPSESPSSESDGGGDSNWGGGGDGGGGGDSSFGGDSGGGGGDSQW